jgi:hypothetical protein
MYKERRGQTSPDVTDFTTSVQKDWREYYEGNTTIGNKPPKFVPANSPPKCEKETQWPALWRWVEEQALAATGETSFGSLSYLLRKNSTVPAAALTET